MNAGRVSLSSLELEWSEHSGTRDHSSSVRSAGNSSRVIRCADQYIVTLTVRRKPDNRKLLEDVHIPQPFTTKGRVSGSQGECIFKAYERITLYNLLDHDISNLATTGF